MAIKISETSNFELKGEMMVKIWRSLNMSAGYNVHGTWDFINNRKDYKTVGFSIDCFGNARVDYSMLEEEEYYYSCGNSMCFKVMDLKKFYVDPIAAEARGIEPQRNFEDVCLQQGDTVYLINRGLLEGSQFAAVNEVIACEVMNMVFSDIVIYKIENAKLTEVIHLVTP